MMIIQKLAQFFFCGVVFILYQLIELLLAAVGLYDFGFSFLLYI